MYSFLNHVKLDGWTIAEVAPMTSQRGNRFAARVATLANCFSNEGLCWVCPVHDHHLYSMNGLQSLDWVLPGTHLSPTQHSFVKQLAACLQQVVMP